MLISEAITYIRQELNDSLSSRWTSDSQVLRFIARAVDRAQHVIRKHAPQLQTKAATLSFTGGVATVALPTDFLAPIVLTRTDGKQMAQVAESDWDSLTDLSEMTAWHVKDNASIEVFATPTANTTATLRYYVDRKPYAMTTASTIPWNGLFDGPIMDYAANRARNVDEMNIQADMQLLQEMELRILDTLLLWGPGTVEGGGWTDGI